MSIGVPKLEVSFYQAATEAANRSKAGIVAVMVREAAAELLGVTVLRRLSDIPATLGADNAAYVTRAFTGYAMGAPTKVLLCVIATVGDTALTDGLTLLANYQIDYLAAPPDVTAEECTSIKDWVVARRAAYATVKAVLPNTAADSIGIINLTASGIVTADGTFTAAQYASRVAGILAGVPSSMSCTYAVLSEVTAVDQVSDAEAAVDAGDLFLVSDGSKVKICRGVNSMTTIPTGGRESWKKIKVVEGMDLITYYARTTIQDEYVGNYPNTYDNKCLLVTALQTYLATLESRGVLVAGSGWADIDVDAQAAYLRSEGIETADMTEAQIRAYDTGSWVFLALGGTIVDAMEDFALAMSL